MLPSTGANHQMPFNELLTTFTNNILPILLIGGAGFLIGKILTVDARTLSRVVFYLFSPLLVFDLLVNIELDFDQALITVGFAGTVVAALGILAFLTGKLFKLERSLLLVVILTTSFGNTGNYGLPLVKFAFGDNALAYATLYFVTTALLNNTVGVIIASLGHMDLKSALLGMFKIPTVYAVLLAAIINTMGLELPLPLVKTIDLAASGSIPLMLVLLGLELTRVQWANSLRAVGLSTFLKLIAGPLIGVLLAIPFGLEPAARQANIIEASMPAAVTNTMLASEYKLEPSLVTAIVFVSTILSPLTLTPLLVYLGR